MLRAQEQPAQDPSMRSYFRLMCGEGMGDGARRINVRTKES